MLRSLNKKKSNDCYYWLISIIIGIWKLNIASFVGIKLAQCL